MTTSDRRLRTRRGRFAGAARKLAVTSALAAATLTLASPAMAEPDPAFECSSSSLHVICFGLDRQDDNTINVHLGIDIHMSRNDAEAILNAPGDELRAKIIGDDPVFDNSLVSVPITWALPGDNGISAEFDINVPWSTLNEDDGYFDGYIDDLFGRITLTDPRNGSTRTFTSPTIHGYY
ncbi:hypothetical protein J5X84_37670 [Streptosporangiaceae bacterium NEAU-GS5]|nr:hypothetical protein [Streptosporangiaceae bacterium NEAU-GS5]